MLKDAVEPGEQQLLAAAVEGHGFQPCRKVLFSSNAALKGRSSTRVRTSSSSSASPGAVPFLKTISFCEFAFRNLLSLICIIWLFCLPAYSGETIDRIVATVNGHAILQSDWDEAVCYEALAEGRALEQITPAGRKASLDRLIDQELLREQAREAERQTNPNEVQKRIQEIRSRYPGAESEAGWRAVVGRYHLSPRQLENRIGVQLEVMRLVDARLRPTIQIDSRSIESYYQQTLVPQLRQAGVKEVPLAEVTPKIKELLTQEKMDQLLVAWLRDLRAESRIRTQPLPPSGAVAGGQSQ